MEQVEQALEMDLEETTGGGARSRSKNPLVNSAERKQKCARGDIFTLATALPPVAAFPKILPSGPAPQPSPKDDKKEEETKEKINDILDAIKVLSVQMENMSTKDD